MIRRCSTCGISWPVNKQNGDEFLKCPSCMEPTSIMSNAQPDFDLEEARSIARHFEFERFYADWDESQPTERLIPDAEPSPG